VLPKKGHEVFQMLDIWVQRGTHLPKERDCPAKKSAYGQPTLQTIMP